MILGRGDLVPEKHKKRAVLQCTPSKVLGIPGKMYKEHAPTRRAYHVLIFFP